LPKDKRISKHVIITKEFLKTASNAIEYINKKDAKDVPNVGSNYAFVCSQLVLSQLMLYPLKYIEGAVKDKFNVDFGASAIDHRDFMINFMSLKSSLEQAHIRLLAKSVSPLGTVHFADTYKQIDESSGPDGCYIVDLKSIARVLQENFMHRKGTTSWIFKHTSHKDFVVESNALEPKPKSPPGDDLNEV
jgi:hypothetical protein